MAGISSMVSSLTQQVSDKVTGKAGRFSANDDLTKNYSIKNMMYPNDLMNDQGTYGGNYVIFYINVVADSKLLKGEGKQEIVENFTPNERGYTVGQNWSKKEMWGGATALNVGGAVLGKVLGVGGASAGAAALAEVGVTALALNANTAKREQKRLKTAIAMHVPNQLSTRYGVQWSEEDTFALSAAVTGLRQGGQEIENALKSNGKSLAKGVAADIVSNLALSKGPNAGALSAATGLAANPKRDQVFKSVDFRNFTFEYQFFPRDEAEAKNVLAIINAFKLHMHPENKDDNNFLYVYPSEFDIVYYSGGRENENINKLTSCVLTEMNVNYTPNGNFTTFANGMPTQINVSMSFRELALLTKELIQKGM